MTVMTQAAGGGRSGSLYDVIELILDRGLVIDAFVRVSLLGIEVLTVEARVVVASVDTYLRFAETASRLDLTGTSDTKGLPELVEAIAEDGQPRTRVTNGTRGSR
jgi:hypothetical protein